MERRTIRRNYVFWAISKSAAVGKKMMAESERSSKFVITNVITKKYVII